MDENHELGGAAKGAAIAMVVMLCVGALGVVLRAILINWLPLTIIAASVFAYNALTGNHVRQADLATFEAKAGAVRMVVDRIETGDYGRRIEALTLTLTNTADVAVSDPSVRCTFAHSFLDDDADDRRTLPRTEVARPSLPFNTVIPAHAQRTFTVSSAMETYRADAVRGLSCAVIDYQTNRGDQVANYRKASR